MMKRIRLLAVIAPLCIAVSCDGSKPVNTATNPAVQTHLQTFPVKGVVRELKSDGRTVVIQHEAIPGYMAAMTMPFKVKEAADLSGLRPGDEISFRLRVTEEESWIDRVVRLSATSPNAGTNDLAATNDAAEQVNIAPSFNLTNIPPFAFTNELGQPVSLRQFAGQAVAMTFFFTRCPIPEYCPRLAKNFQEASQKLQAMPAGPANWRLLSISFDPFDTPPILKAYAQRYDYDSNHWSFLTGPPEQIRELMSGFGLMVKPQAGTIYSHGFLTAVFDASGRLQARWPVGGNTTDNLVAEIVKAAQGKEGGPPLP